MSISVVALSKSWFCSRLLAGIVGSNIIGGMDICLCLLLCLVK